MKRVTGLMHVFRRVQVGGLGAVLIGGMVVAGCSSGVGAPAPAGAGQTAPVAGRPAGGRAGTGQPVPVTAAVAEQRSVPVELKVIGTAEPYSTVQIRAQITGALTAVHFREGDDVQAGQELFSLDRRPLEAALRQAEAQLARDAAQAANARSSAARYQDLAARGIATSEQVDQTRTSASALDATVDADKAAVENATVQLQYATIRSPLSGRTGALMVNAGNLVRANDATPLVIINQVTPVYVSFAVPEARLAELRRSMAAGRVVVSASAPNAAGPADTGHVTFVDNLVDRTTGTIRVKATFANAQRHLWPGQFVNVSVVLSTLPDAVLVPATAVQNGPQGPYAYVVATKPADAGTTSAPGAGGPGVELRLVTVGQNVGDDIVVLSGVTAGETVVTDGQIRLTPGARVSIKPAGGPAAPGRKVAS
ncbi:MAG: efflux RND transporter periplasmic adaptor subunit [Vicinamibacterales bacterium]